jgi:uncharacterized protein (DUF2147 family)
MMLLRILTLGVLFLAGIVTADDRDAVFGRWAGQSSIMEIGESDGVLYARIVSLLNPLYHDGEEGPVGAVRVDLHNPTPALRSRTILGMDLLGDYQYKKGKWQGKLYDPESGKTYESQITVDGDGNLQMRGYIGMPMLGRSVTFKPVSSCEGNVPKMLAMANITSSC